MPKPQRKFHVAIQWDGNSKPTSTKIMSCDEFLDWFLAHQNDRDITSFTVTPIIGSV